MIAKEWRDARWKVLVAAVPVVLLVFLLSPYEEFVREAARFPNENPVSNALRDLSDLYYLGGFFVLMPLAAFLGVASISGEVSSGSNLLLLSRPMSRTRLLLTKYAVSAISLLIAAVLGKVLLLTMAAVRGYPLAQMRVLEAVMSVLVLWLGVLFVLGTALLVSTIFRTITASIVACALTLFLVLWLPWYLVSLLIRMQAHAVGTTYLLPEHVALLAYWMPTRYYYFGSFYGIGGFSYTNFIVCLTAAVVPLLAALWLFNRKAY